MSHRILIADHHPLLRRGLRALLGTNPDYLVIDEASHARDAVARTLELEPDLLVMDLALPGMGSVDVIAQIRRRLPRQKILVLSEHESEIDASEALRAGCTGCLKKDCSPEEMLLAVKTVLAGQRFLGQYLVGILMDGMLQPPGERHLKPWENLSTRERTIFKLIAEGGTNRSAAAYLNLSAKTIEKHRASLMRKLKLNSAVELTLLAVELGLVQAPRVAALIAPPAPAPSMESGVAG